MKIVKTLVLFLAIALVALPAAVRAQSIAGEWDASMSTPGGAQSFKIIFKVDSTKLTGTVKRTRGDVPLEGTVKGKDVTFSYTIDYNGNSLTLSVAAVVTGDTMKGTISFGGQAEDEFQATRAKKTP
jgi:hypothetical protein